MFKKVLVEMRQRVRNGKMTLTLHAVDEMYDDDLLPSDIEHCILFGAINERQWDEDWHEWKYVIEGTATDDSPLEAVAKLGRDGDTVVITVYRLF
jgi:hypothetical protein